MNRDKLGKSNRGKHQKDKDMTDIDTVTVPKKVAAAGFAVKLTEAELSEIGKHYLTLEWRKAFRDVESAVLKANGWSE